MICINDILIITGSLIKELIETRNTYTDLWDYCSIFLGTGTMLVWTGMLRYLKPASLPDRPFQSSGALKSR